MVRVRERAHAPVGKMDRADQSNAVQVAEAKRAQNKSNICINNNNNKPIQLNETHGNRYFPRTEKLSTLNINCLL